MRLRRSTGYGEAGELTRMNTNVAIQEADSARRLELEIIVILMCANPEPVIITLALAGESTIAATDLRGVNAAFLAEV